VELKYELVNNEPFYDFNSDRYVLFFTGKMQNKEHEYGIKIPTSLVFKPLEKAVVKDFLFVHEHEVKSKSWSFWKKKIKNFKKKPTYKDLTTDLNFAPVFYTKNNENEIESLGLAFLHRELYKHSVHYFLGKDHTSNDLDLAQCIFGSSEHDFKGRVQFAPAFVDMHGKQVNNIPTEIILGTPKPTFYPFYLKQKLNGYPASTFSDPKGTINGWKRYLVHQKILAQTFPNNNQNVRTKIKPLPAGVTFTCKIRFHNLKPVELGAILSALTFHNNSDKCFHLIGMAKPLRFGKLKLNEIKLSVTERKGSSLDYMAFFEKEICTIDDKNIFDQWQNDIKPLFKIASGRYTEDIHYPVDFVQFKAIKSKRMSIADFAPPLNDFVIISLNK
jgi:CRISPR-associated protein (TIGR03986 family)